MDEPRTSPVLSEEDISSSEETQHAQSIGSRKRKRSSSHHKISCELCKQRKVKCDRAEPACGWCASHGRPCVYKERQKPGIRVGYGLELEAKINRLEALLQVLGRRVEDHIVEHDSRTQSASPGLAQQTSHVPPYGGTLDTPHTRSDSQTAELSETPCATSTPGHLERGEAKRYVHVETAQAEKTALTPRNEIHVPPPRRSESSYAPPGDQTALYSDPDLPPHDMLYTLVDLYFKHVNTWCPILDRKATFGIFFGSTSISEADRVLLHAIVATTLRFFSGSRLSPHSKKHYHDISKHKVELYGLNHVNVEALKALVILSLDLLGTSNGPLGWNLLALIARNIIQLNLCIENSVYLATTEVPSTGSLARVAMSEPQTWIEDEGRRRLCWMVYILDRYATVATTFDFMLNDKEMDRALPCRYDLFSKNEPVETRSFNWAERNRPGKVINKPENLGSFSYHCEVLRILSRIHDFLKTPVDVNSISEVQAWRNTYRSLDEELNSWLNGLPGEYGKISQLCHSDPASRVANWIMLHAAFVTSVIRLHSSAAYPTVRSHIFLPSYYAMQRCLSAVESLRDIAQDVLDTKGLDLLGPPFAFSLWVSARLLLVHAATIECEVDPKIQFFISTLRHMGQYWEVADNYAKILIRVVQEAQSGERSFIAMRRISYDLTTQTSGKRPSTLSFTTTRLISPSELEYIDVFDFFNFPRQPSDAAGIPPMASPVRKLGDDVLNSHGLVDIRDATTRSRRELGGRVADNAESGTSTSSGGGLAMPSQEEDWLRFEPPYE